MPVDRIEDLAPQPLADFYGRLASGWEEANPGLHPALAPMFLRVWLANRASGKAYALDAPSHLRMDESVTSVLRYHRSVFLSLEKAKLPGGRERMVGILPRLKGEVGFTRWNGIGHLNLDYESLSDIAPGALDIFRLQNSGNKTKLDIFGSLRGWQLKSLIEIEGQKLANGQQQIRFLSWQASGRDVYDFNPNEYLTLPNPDYGKPEAWRVQPKKQSVTVYHTNAIRLQNARLAAPWTVIIRPWAITDRTLLAT
jgi:hypothetical protein